MGICESSNHNDETICELYKDPVRSDALTNPLSANSSSDRSVSLSRSHPLSRSHSPALFASRHEFARQPSLSHEERFLEMFPTICPHLLASRSRYLSRTRCSPSI